IPLGGIVAHRRLGQQRISQLNRLIRNSVNFAFANPTASSEYIRQHAQELSEEVTKAHIQLYVNSFSVELGEIGNRAIETLRSVAQTINLG
ncbi:MAG: 1,4-dihydroxy-6-naphthoate synthase, partial [Bacteroidia bacterium]|nr:1,4-dihydroxy-6-naphthoate synthase [Bacteroidia bacterium]